jgi:hypothetical protein
MVEKLVVAHVALDLPLTNGGEIVERIGDVLE